MLQQVMTNPKEITFNEILVPEIKADQVLAKIMKIVCAVRISMCIMESIRLPLIRLHRDMRCPAKL